MAKTWMIIHRAYELLSKYFIILIIKKEFETSPRIKSNDYYIRPFKRIETHVKRGLESYWVEIWQRLPWPRGLISTTVWSGQDSEDQFPLHWDGSSQDSGVYMVVRKRRNQGKPN